MSRPVTHPTPATTPAAASTPDRAARVGAVLQLAAVVATVVFLAGIESAGQEPRSPATLVAAAAAFSLFLTGGVLRTRRRKPS